MNTDSKRATITIIRDSQNVGFEVAGDMLMSDVIHSLMVFLVWMFIDAVASGMPKDEAAKGLDAIKTAFFDSLERGEKQKKLN